MRVVIILVILIITCVAFWWRRQHNDFKNNNINFYLLNVEKEHFYPAWHDYVIYSQLSRRLKVGVPHDSAMLLDLQAANVDILLYNTDADAIYHLLVTKNVDVIVTTEAHYGFFILEKLPAQVATSKKNILAQKHIVLQNYNTRRLFTFYDTFRLLVANYSTFPFADSDHDHDHDGKIIQIANLTDSMHHLDQALIRHLPCRVMHSDTIDVAHWRSDAYFDTHCHRNANAAAFFDRGNNSTLIDCDAVIPDQYFFLKKDAMPVLSPHVLQRRQQTIAMHNLPYDPARVQCYSSKTIMLTRDDVPDEWLYLFGQSIKKNQASSSYSLQSVLSEVLPLHRTLL